MFFLKDNLEPGTFTPAYCDTDSMGIATCRTDSERLKSQTAEEKFFLENTIFEKDDR